MKNRKICFAALLTGLFCAGCGIFTSHGYREPADYDLLPARQTRLVPAAPIRFGVFSNISGAGIRMLERRKDGKMSLDEYNRWLLPPEQLLRRGMIELFLPVTDREATIQIYCQLLRFETCENKAVLELEYILRSASKEMITMHRFETPLTGKDGSAVARAMSGNMVRSAEKLNGEIAAFAGAAGKDGKK